MILLWLAACTPKPTYDGQVDPDTSATQDTAEGRWVGTDVDVQDVALQLDVATLTGRAEIRVGTATDEVVLDVGDLVLSRVAVDDQDAPHTVENGRLHVPADAGVQHVTVEYTFADHPDWNGYVEEAGFSFTWPYFCGNLFPCNPATSDGMRFSLEVTGAPDWATLVYPESIPTDAPPYMLAFAMGTYVEIPLGTTSAGTRLSVWPFEGGEDFARQGTRNLVAAFDFLEQTYGPYAFGEHAGSVAAAWGDVGGMEHHPFWHVAADSMRSEEVHAHEAAHAWYGDGVRLACWEDLTLSEGTTSYITARALTAVGGPDLFPTYVATLDDLCSGASPNNAVAMPEGCQQIDILESTLWSMVPYMKGACFFEDVADLVGADVVDRVIADFYAAHVGAEAATMEEMVAALRAATPEAKRADFDARVTDWLVNLACPTDYAERCSARGN